MRTDSGEDAVARYLITAVGTLSDTNMPPFKGLERFRGRWYHTSRFPHSGVDFTDKRVGVVGTGATAVQAIPEIAQQAKQLTVFQRTANYCVPARNGKVDPEVVKARKADYDGIIERIRQSVGGFELYRIPKSALEATAEEREREFDRMWDAGGFAFRLANYQDMFFSQEANDLCADYIKRKIRKTVKDPVVAEKLIPKHPFGTKRTPASVLCPCPICSSWLRVDSPRRSSRSRMWRRQRFPCSSSGSTQRSGRGSAGLASSAPSDMGTPSSSSRARWWLPWRTGRATGTRSMPSSARGLPFTVP